MARCMQFHPSPVFVNTNDKHPQPGFTLPQHFSENFLVLSHDQLATRKKEASLLTVHYQEFRSPGVWHCVKCLWELRQYVPSKRREMFTQRSSITSHKTPLHITRNTSVTDEPSVPDAFVQFLTRPLITVTQSNLHKSLLQNLYLK
jgi:hypothetical protein